MVRHLRLQTDEATSALDVTSRLLVHEAIKRWRKNRTTIIITHDLSPIEAEDYVYVLADGELVEEGYRCDLEANPTGTLKYMADLQAKGDSEGEDEEEKEKGELQEQQGLLPPWIEPERRSSVGFGGRRFSLIPDTSLLTSEAQLHSANQGHWPLRRDSDMSLLALERVGQTASTRRPVKTTRKRIAHDVTNEKLQAAETKVEIEVTPDVTPPRDVSIWQLTKILYPYVPNKFIMFLGFIFCIALGTTTPIFSMLLSTLLSGLVPGSGINLPRASLMVLLIAGIDGISQCLRYSLLQRAAMGWITQMRGRAFTLIMGQDKAWFDKGDSSVIALVNLLVKDTEDARNLLGMIAGQALAVFVMLSLGIIWALVVGWELTLAGFAVAPFFMVSLVWQSGVVDRYERVNKVLRESASKKFHQVRYSFMSVEMTN